MTILRSGSATDVGRIRQINQDMALESTNLFAVADGMGGHAGGEVAAQVAVESLRSAFARQPSTEGLEQAVLEANQAVWSRSQSEADLHGMGTTLTAVALVAGADGRDVVALANVGDSRAYLYSGGEIAQLTFDHSLAEERVRLGEISQAEAAVDPRRHILTRALGVAPDVSVDLWELRPQTGDRILLCSDGLSNEVAPGTLAEVLGSVADPAEASQRLVDAAVAHGGSDNITVVVIDVLLGEDGAEGPDGPPPAMAAEIGEVAGPAATASTAGGEVPVGDEAVPPPKPAGTGTEAPAGGSPPVGAPAADSALLAGGGAPVATLAPSATIADAPVAPEFRKETRRERRRRLGVPRRITFRVVFFFLLVVGVVAAAYYGVRYYANDNWFVTLKGNQLVIYRGQPGGVLWFHPKLVDKTGVTTQQILPIRKADLEADVDKSSLSAAQKYVRSLEQEYLTQQAAQQSSSSSSAPNLTGTTTTTLPGFGGRTTTTGVTRHTASTTTTVTDTPGPTAGPTASGPLGRSNPAPEGA